MITIILVAITISFLYDLLLVWFNIKQTKLALPTSVSGIYDKDNYSEWMRYSKLKYKQKIIYSLFILLYNSAFLIFGIYKMSTVESMYWSVILYILIYYSGVFIIKTVRNYYNEFLIEKKYGFSKVTKGKFLIKQLIKLIAQVAIAIPIIMLLIYVLDNGSNTLYIISLSVIAFIIIIIELFSINFLASFSKTKEFEDNELKDEVIKVLSIIGYENTKILLVESKDSTKLDAYFGGVGKFKRILISTSIIEKLTIDEIIAVILHEIAHHKRHHTYIDLIDTFIKSGVYLLLFVFTVSSYFLDGLSNPGLGFSIIIFFMLLAPLMNILRALASPIARMQEYQADKFAVDQGYGLHMISGLKKAAKENLVNLNPHPLFVRLKYSHPTIGNRIDSIEKAIK